MSEFKKGDKKIINGWVMYDWANSAYPLVITTAIFPLFYGFAVADRVNLFGGDFSRIEIYSYTIALSHIIVSILSPILSGMADYSGNKKMFMRIFNYIGAGACVAMYFFAQVPLVIGLLMVFLANIGFWGSLVFYNAYLPEIAEPKDHDRISARGFSMGYIGSSILLVISLIMVMASPDEIKIDMMRYSFVLTGIWWLGFSQITYARLPRNIYKKQHSGKIVSQGFLELKKVWKEFRKIPRLKRFLRAFFIYSMAVQTVMTMAQFFGTDAVDWSFGMDFSSISHLKGDEFLEAKENMVNSYMQTGMIISILVIQLIAVPGAYLFAKSSGRWGNVKVLMVAVFVWVLICASAYVINTPIEFYILAAVVGFVMGGIQSLSRSTYSKFLPETEDHASYFSFYDVLEKIGVAIGIISFGFLEGAFNIRYSVMALMVFFIAGFILLVFVPKDKV